MTFQPQVVLWSGNNPIQGGVAENPRFSLCASTLYLFGKRRTLLQPNTLTNTPKHYMQILKKSKKEKTLEVKQKEVKKFPFPLNPKGSMENLLIYLSPRLIGRGKHNNIQNLQLMFDTENKKRIFNHVSQEATQETKKPKNKKENEPSVNKSNNNNISKIGSNTNKRKREAATTITENSDFFERNGIDPTEIFIGNINILDDNKEKLIRFIDPLIKQFVENNRKEQPILKRTHMYLKDEDFYESLRFRSFNQDFYESVREEDSSNGVKTCYIKIKEKFKMITKFLPLILYRVKQNGSQIKCDWCYKKKTQNIFKHQIYVIKNIQKTLVENDLQKQIKVDKNIRQKDSRVRLISIHLLRDNKSQRSRGVAFIMLNYDIDEANIKQFLNNERFIFFDKEYQKYLKKASHKEMMKYDDMEIEGRKIKIEQFASN